MNLFLRFAGSLPLLFYLFLSSNPNVYGTLDDGIPEGNQEAGRFFMKEKNLSESDILDTESSSKPMWDFLGFNSKGNDSEKDPTSFNKYNFLVSFVNQTRATAGIIAHIGNFTLIQAALLFAIGSMACGAAIIALEGLAFRQRETEIALYHQNLVHQHAAGFHAGKRNDYYDSDSGSISSNSNPPDSLDPYPVPVPEWYNEPMPYNLYSNETKSRGKRDTDRGQMDVVLYDIDPQITMPLSSGFTRRKSHQEASYEKRPTSLPVVGAEEEFRRQQERLHSLLRMPLYGLRYHTPKDFAMLNRLGLGGHFRKRNRVRPQNNREDNDDVEYFRGIPLDTHNVDPLVNSKPLEFYDRKLFNRMDFEGKNHHPVTRKRRNRKYWKRYKLVDGKFNILV